MNWKNKSREGRSQSSATNACVESLMQDDKRRKIRIMTLGLDLPKSAVHEIVYENLVYQQMLSLYGPRQRQPVLSQPDKRFQRSNRYNMLHPQRSRDLTFLNDNLFGLIKQNLFTQVHLLFKKWALFILTGTIVKISVNFGWSYFCRRAFTRTSHRGM